LEFLETFEPSLKEKRYTGKGSLNQLQRPGERKKKEKEKSIEVFPEHLDSAMIVTKRLELEASKT
jgi:hypothetical protein